MEKSNAISLIIILIISFAVYSNTLDNQFLYDDDDFFVRNAYTKDWSHLKNIFTENVIAGSGLTSNYYRPILSLSFLADYSLWGLNPLGYHIFNILTHGLVSYLVYLLINLILQNWRVSLISAIVYAAHPVHTEAVAYVTGRADPLSALFGLSSFFLFLRLKSSTGKMRFFYLAISLLFFLLGLMSREGILILPLLLALYLLCFEEREISLDSLWKTFLRISPYIVILGIYMAARLTILNFSNTLNFYNEQNVFTENIWFRVLTFLSVLLEYYKIIFFPVHLNYERAHPIFIDFFDPVILLSSIILIGIIFVMHKSWKNSKIIFFGFSLFFVTLFPVSNIIVPVNGIIYEHWLYMPLIGISLIFGYIIKNVTHARFFTHNDYFRALFFVLIIGFIVFLAARTCIRNDDWQDAFTFYSKTIKDAPNSVRINNNLAMEYDSRGYYQQAISYYKKAALQNDKFAQPHYNMANTYVKMGNYYAAIENYEMAISKDPNFLFTYPKLIQLYDALGRKEDAQRVVLQYNSKVKG